MLVQHMKNILTKF